MKPWILLSIWLVRSAYGIAAYPALSLTPSPSLTSSASTPAFTYDSRSFLLHGEPYVIIGGQMDPQRIPAEYWRDRLAKARAMGLNTIFSYVFWNLLEPKQGEWRNHEGSNNIAEYFKIAQQEGLNVVLRPGPYICGERDWGGFPAWLGLIPGITVRSDNAQFINASRSYLQRLAEDLRDLQVTKGGPLLMVQVENEYGSYGSNHKYTAALRDILQDLFEVPLYTNDGGVDWTLRGGHVPGALAAIDGDPSGGFRARDAYITDKSELGPLLDGEYYTTGPDFWGPSNTHSTDARRSTSQAAQFARDLDFVLGANNSISLYMFHGGTNFGLSNGAIWKGYTAAFITSYDYGSPLDESGRTNDLYFTLRKTIQKYVPAGSIPDPPANLPLSSIPKIELSPVGSLFGIPSLKTTNTSPVTMEALSQSYGFVLYEHKATKSLEGRLQPGDRARDRVLVYVNGVRRGVIDSTYARPAPVTLSLQPDDKLQLLVENLGRVDYWSQESGTFNALLDPFKGIMGNVTIGRTVVEGWDISSFPLDDPPVLSNSSVTNVTVGDPPQLYFGTFEVGNKTDNEPSNLDTFISIPDGIKGVVWVNGFNLGRYWIVGPQQSLYLPGTVLNAGMKNEIVVLELEPKGEKITAEGLSERIWGNKPDPDAP